MFDISFDFNSNVVYDELLKSIFGKRYLNKIEFKSWISIFSFKS